MRRDPPLLYEAPLCSAALCDKCFLTQAQCLLRICRIVQTKDRANCASRRSEMHFNEHFPFFRGGVLPGIRRPGVIEHFYVPLWVSFEKNGLIFSFSKGIYQRISCFFSPVVFCLFLESSSSHETDQKEKSRISISSGWRRFPVSSLTNPPHDCAPCADTFVRRADALISWVRRRLHQLAVSPAHPAAGVDGSGAPNELCCPCSQGEATQTKCSLKQRR